MAPAAASTLARNLGNTTHPLRVVLLRSLAEALGSGALGPGLREPGLQQSARPIQRSFVFGLFDLASGARDRGVTGRTAVPGGPHEQRVGPVVAVRATHPLMHQRPISIAKRSMPALSLLQTVQASGKCPVHPSAHQASRGAPLAHTAIDSASPPIAVGACTPSDALPQAAPRDNGSAIAVRRVHTASASHCMGRVFRPVFFRRPPCCRRGVPPAARAERRWRAKT